MPKKKFWEFKNKTANSAELLLYGEISDTSWWGDEVTPKEFAEDLAALGPVSEITVRINSGGGDVFAAQAIGNQLESNPANVIAQIDGLCASAATIVACHCNKVTAAEDGTYMIHPVKMGLLGYYESKDLETYVGALATIRENILSLYVRKTGRDKDELAAQMDATSWMTSAEAKENGFVDELINADGTAYENRGGLLFVNSIDSKLPFDKAPKFVKDSVAAAPAASSSDNKTTGKAGTENGKEDPTMEIKTADDLKKAYPELVAQLEEAAANKARNEERQRIREIEDMALPGSEELTNSAKFEKPISAEDYAKEAIKNAKAQGATHVKNAQEDAVKSGANSVPQAEGDDKAYDFAEDIKKASK